MGTTANVAQANNAVTQVARVEVKIHHQITKKRLGIRRIHALGLVDTVSAGISLIIYSAYCFLTTWLFFVGIHRGAKAGCDVFIFFIFAPISVYNHRFIIFLKFISVLFTLFGFGFLVFGSLFLIVGLCKPFEKHPEHSDKDKDLVTDGQPAQTTAQSSSGTEPQNQLAQPRPTMSGALGAPIPQGPLPVAHPYHHWLPSHMHLPAIRQHYFNYVANSVKTPSIKEVDEQIDFKRFQWGAFLTIVLGFTILVVEKTIKVNHLEMGPLLSSTGQLIALLVGAFMLLLILYRLLVKLYWHEVDKKKKKNEKNNKDGEKKEDTQNNFAKVSGALQRWFHTFMDLFGTGGTKTASGANDHEKLVGLENGGQEYGQTGLQSRMQDFDGQGHAQTGVQTGLPDFHRERITELVY